MCFCCKAVRGTTFHVQSALGLSGTAVKESGRAGVWDCCGDCTVLQKELRRKRLSLGNVFEKACGTRILVRRCAKARLDGCPRSQRTTDRPTPYTAAAAVEQESGVARWLVRLRAISFGGAGARERRVCFKPPESGRVKRLASFAVSLSPRRATQTVA